MDCFAEPVIGKNWPDAKSKPGNSASLRAYLSPRRHAASLALVAGNGANTPRLRQWGIAEIFSFAPDPNQLHIQTVSSHSRGVSRSSRTRGGMRWTRQCPRARDDGRAGFLNP